MRRLVVLGMLLGLMALLQALQAGSDALFNPLSLATFGFVLLAAYTLGQAAAGVQLPKITGYIVTGLVFGPQLFNVFSSAVEADLRVVNDLAIGLIALSAGAEMHLSGLKRIARSLFWIVAIKSTLILAAVMATVFALASFIPFLADQPPGLILAVGMILGVLAMGTSPAATIAVISETGAKGRLADTTLGVAVAKDIVMVVLLALGIALARTFSPEGQGFDVAILRELALDLLLSLIAGALLGAVIIAYIRYLGAELWLFVVGVIFAMTAIAQQFHLEALLVFIVAGFVVQNASPLGHAFVELVERVALPVYVVFFSVAGAGLDLAGLRTVLPVALALVSVRLLAIYFGTGLATRIADEPEPIRRNAWLAFVTQAGVVIGLSIIVENNLPGLGSDIRALVMGTVAIHLLLGPMLFKMALSRVGETRIEREVVEAHAEAAAGDSGLGELPAEIASTLADFQDTVMVALAELQTAARSGPLALARDVRGWPRAERDRREARVEEEWSRELVIAADRFWSEVHRAALAAPRQLVVQLGEQWFRRGEHDSGAQRWVKRLRRARRLLRRVSGREPVLERTVPFRALALYHVDKALSTDLEPVLAAVAAQPALTLREGLREAGPLGSGTDAETGAEGVDLNADARLVVAVSARFNELRGDLGSVGTVELSGGRRRPSVLHERAKRARSRSADAVRAWEDFARSVVQHELRREAVEELRRDIRKGSAAFQRTVQKRLDAVVLAPVRRAREAVASGREALAALDGMEPGALEEGVLGVEEAVSGALRRRSLAGLRRAVETRPLNAVLRVFDDDIEDRLKALPERFRVVDPDELPDPARPFRNHPEPASYEFGLIATGAVERTLRPSLEQFRRHTDEALDEAVRSVHAVREQLEVRFDAAVDAVIEVDRDRSGGVAAVRAALAIALDALDDAEAELLTTDAALLRDKDDALSGLRSDFDALIERLPTELASARRLEAQLQARRAQVELEGSAVVRLLGTRVQGAVEALRSRLGLLTGRDEGEESPAPLKPGGPAGSDRAVLYHILFDDSTLAGKVFDAMLILTILVSILILMLESVEPIRAANGTALTVLEWLFTLLFTLEYAARLWAVDRPARYAFSFFGLIDLLAVIPTYLSLVVPGGQYLMVVRVLRVARAFRVLKLSRYVGEAQILVDALRASRYKITVFLVYVVSVAVVVGSAMYLIEGPEAGFTSIPRGVYWSIVTLTTVGFGDITPQSPIGQMLAAVLMILGYGIIAVPTGIVTAEVAAQPARGRVQRTCDVCGHEVDEPGAVYCPMCAETL